jgi:hypothetical protein
VELALSDLQTSQLRALLLGLLSRCQHQPTIQTALAKFNDHVAKGTELVPDLRGTIFATAARTNDPKLVEDLKQIMKQCDFSEIERACVMGSFTCTELLQLPLMPFSSPIQRWANAWTRPCSPTSSTLALPRKT